MDLRYYDLCYTFRNNMLKDVLRMWWHDLPEVEDLMGSC